MKILYIKNKEDSNLIMEIEKDLCFNAGNLIAKGIIDIKDSREFINIVVPILADKFRTEFDTYDPYYIEIIHEFSLNELIKLYGN
jgi:hypothetical protein